MSSDLSGWLGVLLSSTACIVGASIVFIDRFSHKSLLDNRSFMASSMALASGVLLFSSLSILFPQAQDRLKNDAIAYSCFFSGACFTVVLTRIIHTIMPDAIHACGEATKDCHHHASNNPERTKIKNSHPCDIEYGSVRSSQSHFRFHHDEYVHQENNGAAESSDASSESPSADRHNSHESVEQIMQSDPGHYYSIGIQTAIAICVHKFPEGLIMFISSQASSALGISVGIAMSIHNLTEGFMIALPLYYATRSRTSAFTYAAILGGLSQPIGALIGLFLIKNISQQSEDLLFGIVFGCVSGMMSLITIQSMLPQAIRADTNQSYVVAFFFLGIFLVGLSSVLEVA
ncbi:Zinc/iron permease [Choanephora cucurbitarum]|nr:Zinc/iron permease [Choanephora cucurbitarum]